MAVGYTGSASLAMQAGMAMLAASATLQGLVTGGNVYDVMIESDGGVSTSGNTAIPITTTKTITLGTTGMYLVVHEAEFTPFEVALNTYGYQGIVRADVWTLLTNGDKAPEVMRRLRNIAGGLQGDLHALYGTSTSYFARGWVELTEFVIADRTKPKNLYDGFTALLHYSVP